MTLTQLENLRTSFSQQCMHEKNPHIYQKAKFIWFSIITKKEDDILWNKSVLYLQVCVKKKGLRNEIRNKRSSCTTILFPAAATRWFWEKHKLITKYSHIVLSIMDSIHYSEVYCFWKQHNTWTVKTHCSHMCHLKNYYWHPFFEEACSVTRSYLVLFLSRFLSYTTVYSWGTLNLNN